MLYQILKDTSERLPNKIAAVYDDREYTYHELLLLTDRMANALLRLGMKKGDRLAFYLYNCPEIIICYFACFKIGVTVIPINYRLKEDEAHYIIDHSKPRVLISQKSLFSQIADNIPALSSVERSYLIDSEGEFADTLLFSDLMNPVESPTAYAEIPGKTEAAVLYTSGTTGKPKGAVLAHDQMMTHTVGHCKLVNYQPQDRTLVCLALSNNFAFSHQMLSSLYTGATLEINAAFDPDEVLEKIERSGVTMLYMMPVMFHALNKQAAVKNLPIPNHLRLAIVAGDTTPFVVLNRFKEIFGLEMCEGIGMTETQIYTLNPLGKGKKKGSVGLPVGYTEVAIQDDQGYPLPVGKIGEIAVKGEIVMRSYLNNPKVTAESFRNGWFLTGDLGYFDDDSYLWFRGRRKQLILHDGSNISPQEVEEVFYHHPAVFEVGVIGAPDKFEGEMVHAFVALKPEAETVSEEELLAFAKEHLADYKLPESITFIDALPKGATGKIDRKLLKKYDKS
ncbi:class I adenylate-forming enzyme family protein [Sulfurovum sp. CS9]|uniref:class I adenylate-forming enzyme family protein n=1 Tax=Sulfurovum sp. CS9 TaxID=3391146 RepID=UPI0039E895AC